MDTVRVGTFNCENLFARYRFRQNFEPTDADGFSINNLAFEIFDDAAKRITAAAIKEVTADIIALQEVENLLVLDRFHGTMLQGRLYPHRLLIDGNDPRNIDLAVMSKYPIRAAKTYRHERNNANNAELFSRDCLEVDFDIGGKELTLFVNHFKSMMGGREATKSRRMEQAKRVAKVVTDRFGKDFSGNFAVVGDLNDYPEKDGNETTSLTSLLKHPGLVNVIEHLPKEERWTHWYKGGAKGKKKHQLDYIFLGKALNQRAGAPVPEVMRKGLPWRAEDDYPGERFAEVGFDDPKASDHCPMVVELPISALI